MRDACISRRQGTFQAVRLGEVTMESACPPDTQLGALLHSPVPLERRLSLDDRDRISATEAAQEACARRRHPLCLSLPTLVVPTRQRCHRP